MTRAGVLSVPFNKKLEMGQRQFVKVLAMVVQAQAEANGKLRILVKSRFSGSKRKKVLTGGLQEQVFFKDGISPGDAVNGKRLS
jgi:hypothetical protein